MTRTLDHHLHALRPGALRQLAEGLQLRQLRIVGGVGQAAGSQAVAEGERHVVLAHDVADLVEHLVHRVVLTVDQHPLGEQRSAAGDDADQALLDVLQMLPADAGVDREVVDALLRLVFDHLEDDVVGQILDLATDDHRVDRYRADRHSGVLDDRLAAGVEIAAGGQVHHRVGAPAHRPLHLLHLFVGARRHGRRAEIGVDLGLRGAADGHGIESVAEVDPVGGNDHASRRHLVTHLHRRQVQFAGRHSLHLRRDFAEPGPFQLGDGV